MNKIKKIIVLLALLIITILQIIPTPVEARAGGGSSGGSSVSHGTTNISSSTTDPLSSIFGILAFAIISSSSIIIMKIKITKYRYNARKDFKDTDWNYKELVNGRKSIFCITKSLEKNEINLAKDYLTKELYENYKSKLQWM